MSPRRSPDCDVTAAAAKAAAQEESIKAITFRTAAEKYIGNFAHAVDGDPAIGKAIEQHTRRGWDGIIVPIRCARELSRSSHKGPGDHAADFMRSAEDFARDGADPV